ncbi:MAG: VOC family protein [Bacteroidetes bacterium]|nr:MAG: VOC family protein [Bacteroidota bacterium]
MKIRLLSVPVKDQEKALQFYTEVLGFVKKHDVPVGNGNRWLTVVSKEEPDGPEVLLEPAPLHFEPAKAWQEALYEAGMPCARFLVADLAAEYERLKALGVSFRVEPTDIGTAKFAILDDTCGNYIQILEMV